uniref:Xylulose kinase-1 n=1 Tax=Tanacetum cinerariifolium TaxID=118510 RepID=A0A6L2L2M3_TANCI|nr:xylulose kinase-1 [Tanacetum cinerariifolium]
MYPPTHPSQPQINHSSNPPSHPYQSQVNHQTLSILQIAYNSPQPLTEFPQMDLGLAVLVFNQGGDQIACLKKAMDFITAVTSSRPGNAAWYKEKEMLAEALEARQILDEEQLAFLVDPGILDGQATQTTIPNTTTFQTKDLDAYDSDCDDVSYAKAVLMANLSSNGSDVLLEEKANQEKNNELVTTKLERYKERVKTFEQPLNVDLKLFDEQAFWLQTSHPNTDQSASSPVKVEAPQELPKDALSNNQNALEILEYFENNDLKAQLQAKDTTIWKEVENIAQIPIATTVAPGMFNLDLNPLALRLFQNRHAHIYYLKHTQEQVDILQGIVKQAKAKQPIDNALDLPGLGHNLFSVGQFYDAELKVALRKSTCFIRLHDDLRVTAAHVYVSAVKLNLVLFSNANENYAKCSTPYTENFMPPKPDLILTDVDEYVLSESLTNVPIVATSIAKTSESKPKSVSEPLIEDWIYDNEDENETKSKSKQRKPSFAKKMVKKPVWNNARRVNHQNSQRLSHPHPKRNFVPRAVLIKSGLKKLNTARQNSSRAAVSVNTAKPINTAYPRPIVNSARPRSNVFNRAHSHVRRPFNKFTTYKNNNFNQKVNTVKGNVTIVRPKAVVSDNKGNEANAVKASTCCVWRPKQNVLDHLKVNVVRHKLTTAVEETLTQFHHQSSKPITMSITKFAEGSNMIAFLSKPNESAGFEEIIDFLNAHPIKYALTVSPTIYSSYIEQFWATAKVKHVNEKAQLHAKVDGKRVVISEASIRRDLRFEDEVGIACLPNKAIFEQLTLMGKTRRKDTELPQTSVPIKVVANKAVYEEMYDSVDMAATTATGLDVKDDRGSRPRRLETMGDAAAYTRSERVSRLSNDPSLSRVNTLRSGEDRQKLTEWMEFCTQLQSRVLALETTKTNQALEIGRFKRKVKNLEKKASKKTHKLNILYKIGSLRIIESSDEASLCDQEDASK